MKALITSLIILLSVLFLQAQESTWRVLQTVDFEQVYSEEMGIHIDVPKFGPWITALEGQEIDVQGYIIPLKGKIEQSYFMFSALPYNMCFFCGKAGPETAMEVYMEEGDKLKYTEDKIWLRGILELNDNTVTSPIYTLRYAQVIKRKD